MNSVKHCVKGLQKMYILRDKSGKCSHHKSKHELVLLVAKPRILLEDLGGPTYTVTFEGFDGIKKWYCAKCFTLDQVLQFIDDEMWGRVLHSRLEYSGYTLYKRCE